MVSGFLISPYDHDRIFSGLAIEIRIWSKTCAGTCGLKIFMISWFIVVSACRHLSAAVLFHFRRHARLWAGHLRRSLPEEGVGAGSDPAMIAIPPPRLCHRRAAAWNCAGRR